MKGVLCTAAGLGRITQKRRRDLAASCVQLLHTHTHTPDCESKLGVERSAVFRTYGMSVGFLAVYHHPQHGPKTMGSS